MAVFKGLNNGSGKSTVTRDTTRNSMKPEMACHHTLDFKYQWKHIVRLGDGKARKCPIVDIEFVRFRNGLPNCDGSAGNSRRKIPELCLVN